MEREKNIISNVFKIIDGIIYYAVLIPLLIITVIIVYKSIRYKERIPDILGYKMFMILDPNTNDKVKFGDLIFTKNLSKRLRGK